MLAPDTAYKAHVVPLPKLPWDNTSVQAVDLAIGEDRALHCVASINYGPRGSHTGTNLYYLRGERGSSAWDWTPAQEILHDRAKNARILVAGKRLHILTGLILSHYISDDNGMHWHESGTLVEYDSAGVKIFDAAAVGDTLIIAYTSWLRATSGPYFVDDSRTMLHVVRWSPSGTQRDEVVAGYPVPANSTPGPRLAVSGNTVHLVAGIREDHSDWSAGTGVKLPARGALMQFDYHRSDDAGRTWTRRSRLPLAREWDLGAYGRIGDVVFGNPDLAVAASSSGAWAFWGLIALHGHRLVGVDQWGQAQRLSAHPIFESDVSLGSTSVQAIAVGEGSVVTWISLAHARPETGPDWRPNNDIYLSAYAESDTLPRSIRLPTGFAYTKSVKMRVRGDSVYVLRHGFDSSTPDSYRSQPRGTFYCIPLRNLLPGKHLSP